MSGAPDLGLTREQALALLGQHSQPPANPFLGSPTAAPDFGFSREQTLAMLRDSDPHMSTGEDVARSAAGGGQRAISGLAAGPRDLGDLAQHGLQAGVDFLSRHGMGDGSFRVPQVGHVPGAPNIPGLGDLLQAATGAVANRLHVDPHMAQLGMSAMSPLAAMAGPNTEQGSVALNQGLPVHKPQTTAGRYAQRIAEMSPMATTGGGPLASLLNVAVPGVASQLGEDMAPEPYKGGAALAGALLGGGVVAAGRHIARAPHAAFGSAMGDLTDEQVSAAQQLRQDAAARGLNLTLPEAVQQVTNNGTGLGRLQRVVESTKQGQKLTAPYFAERPDQVSNAVRSFADTIAPATDQPGMVGQRAQEAATGALDQARQVVNRTAGPDYAALSGQTMEPEAYQELASNSSYKVALDALRTHPELGAAIAHLPDNNLSVINAVKQRLATLGEQAKGTPLTPGDNQLAGVRFGAKGLADELARRASPNYAAANDTVRELSGQYVDPLKAGPLGAISQTPEVKAQTAALYPGIPAEGAPAETSQAVRVLGHTAPGVADDLTRQHIVNTLNESLSNLQGGQNQYAGAKLAAALGANPEQAATLHAGVSALPEGAAKSADLESLLQALQATGKRQQPGSMTAFNESDLKDLHIAPYANAVGRITDPLEWGKGLGDILNRANYRRNVNRLADMIMADPDQTSAVLNHAEKASRGSGPSAFLPAMLQARGRKK